MTKGELVDRVSTNTGLSKRQTKEALDVTLNAIGGALSRGEEVSFPGFG
jgi:nucleoid DNA-binding protein